MARTSWEVTYVPTPITKSTPAVRVALHASSPVEPLAPPEDVHPTPTAAKRTDNHTPSRHGHRESPPETFVYSPVAPHQVLSTFAAAYMLMPSSDASSLGWRDLSIYVLPTRPDIGL